jgi:hypothetical protein
MDILPWVLMVSKSTLLTKSHFPSESEMVEIKQLEEDFEYNQVESLLISGFSLYGMSDQDYSYSLKLAAKAIERQRLFPVSYSPPRYPHNINFNIFQELRKAREYNRVAGFFPK